MLTQKNHITNQAQTMEKSRKSKPTTFKALQRETSVYKFYVELKENVLTERGYLDLSKVPDLYISGAGQFLKNLRLENCLRQYDIAEILDVSRSKINNWENNECRMPLHKLVKIAELLDVTRDTIYSLINQGKFKTKSNFPVKLEKISIIQYFTPHKDDDRGRITLLKCCPDEVLRKIKETLNVNLRYRRRNKIIITCREAYNFLTTFFKYSKVPKIRPPLTTEVKGWYDDAIDLKLAVIIPFLQSDGYMSQNRQKYRLDFFGYNKVLHDYFVDSMHYECNKLPSSYFISGSRIPYTSYSDNSLKKIRDDIMNLAGNTKTSPANGQTPEEYLKEPQPHLEYLRTASVTELQIALRIWASTEGSISIYRKDGYIYPDLRFGCSHPDLVKQLQQKARQFNIDFNISRSKRYWSGIQGLSTSALSSCIEFLKLGGFIKDVKISSNSPYHEGISKNVLFLGILEYKKRILENSRPKKLPIQQVHYKINKIVENREYKSADYYINYFS